MRKIDIRDCTLNPFQMLSKQWALLAAGDEKKFNMMTVSWGGVGILWNKPVVTVYVRENRYTKEFIDAGETFTLSFLEDGNRDALNILGAKSGREMDKVKDSGLAPVFLEGAPTFAESEMTLVCRKLYHQEMPADCFDDRLLVAQNYPDGNFHTMYVGEIVAAYRK